MQGVTVGTMISFYDKALARFDGAEKLASGIVKAVTALESTVDLRSPKREVTVEDKAVVLAPDLGTMRFKVDVDVDSAKFTPEEKKVIEATRTLLTPSSAGDEREVELVRTRAGDVPRWDVAILKDKFANVASKIVGAKNGRRFNVRSRHGRMKMHWHPPGNLTVTFSISPDATCPALWVLHGDIRARRISRSRAPAKSACRHIAALKSIRLIENKRSALKGKIAVISLAGKRTSSEMFTEASMHLPISRRHSIDTRDGTRSPPSVRCQRPCTLA